MQANTNNNLEARNSILNKDIIFDTIVKPPVVIDGNSNNINQTSIFNNSPPRSIQTA